MIDTVERELDGAVEEGIECARAFAGYIDDAGNIDPETVAGPKPIDTGDVARSLEAYLVTANAVIDLLEIGNDEVPGCEFRGALRRFLRHHRNVTVLFPSDPADGTGLGDDVLALGLDIDARRRRFYFDVPSLPDDVENAYSGERYASYARPDGRPKVPVSGLCREGVDCLERWATRQR